MMLYLTVGDAYSGVYSSQVIDVVRYLRRNLDPGLRLISFQSPKIYFSERKSIHKNCKHATVLPAYPGITNWKKNIPLLSLISLLKKPKEIIARGVFAANIALELRKRGLVDKVVYDGRGAVAAEWEEYGYGQRAEITKSIAQLERNAVLNADMRIAVSKSLVNYWRDSFCYSGDKHEVIPCLLSEKFLKAAEKAKAHRSETRKKLGFNENSIVLVFSGGLGDWQSTNLLVEKIRVYCDSDSRVCVLILSKSREHFHTLIRDYPERVRVDWVDPDSVPHHLIIADYGLLIREPSITNAVAAPTKFAEYLALGLKILISSDVGDYSDFVKKHSCGTILTDNEPQKLTATKKSERDRLAELAQRHFTKDRFKMNYGRICLK